MSYLVLLPLILLGVIAAASAFGLLSACEEITCAFGSLDSLELPSSGSHTSGIPELIKR